MTIEQRIRFSDAMIDATSETADEAAQRKADARVWIAGLNVAGTYDEQPVKFAAMCAPQSPVWFEYRGRTFCVARGGYERPVEEFVPSAYFRSQMTCSAVHGWIDTRDLANYPTPSDADLTAAAIELLGRSAMSGLR